MELTGYGLAELAGLLRGRKASAVEIAQACFRKIRLEDGAYHSFLRLCEERAMGQAAAAQQKLDKGEGGPLTGLPVALKDNICVAGVPTTCASRMLADFVPPYTATAAARLEAAGMVVIGKTNMDEFAMGGSSLTSYFGGPRNPLDTNLVAGGSSGGSAAAVAAGFVPAALGSDTGGSVRQPAAFCGLAGLRPTYGSVSRYGLVAFCSSMDQIGPMARRAADCGLLLSAMAGRDDRDATTKEPPDTNYGERVGSSLRGMNVGLPRAFLSAEVEEEVKEAVLGTAKVFEEMGCAVREVSLPSLRFALAAYYLLSSAEAAANLSRYDGVRYGYRAGGADYGALSTVSRREGFGDEVKKRILLGNYALTAGYYDQYYRKAQAVRSRLRAEFGELFRSCDFLLTPTAPTAAYPVEEKPADPLKKYTADLYTVPASLAGLPALSFPAGRTAAGLPVGVSLTGPAFREAALIGAADAYERFTGKGAAE